MDKSPPPEKATLSKLENASLDQDTLPLEKWADFYREISHWGKDSRDTYQAEAVVEKYFPRYHRIFFLPYRVKRKIISGLMRKCERILKQKEKGVNKNNSSS